MIGPSFQGTHSQYTRSVHRAAARRGERLYRVSGEVVTRRDIAARIGVSEDAVGVLLMRLPKGSQRGLTWSMLGVRHAAP